MYLLNLASQWLLQLVAPKLPREALIQHPLEIETAKLVAERKFDVVERLFDKERTDGRTALSSRLVRRCMKPNSFDDWIEADPYNMWPWFLKGLLYTELAWDHRGTGHAELVRENGRQKFFNYLREAEAFLDRAVAFAPQDPLPLLALIPVYMATRDDPLETMLLFKRAQRLEELSVLAHLSLQQAITPKWGGSFEMMEDFGEDCLKRSHRNGALACIVPDAHIEVWLIADDIDWDMTSDQYLKSDDVQRDIVNAHEMFFVHYDDKNIYDNRAAHNRFAFVFDKMGMYDYSSQHLQQLNLKISDAPWGYEFFPKANFVRAHQRAGVWLN